MLFHVYGGNALYQWGAMILVLVGLILLNEVARSEEHTSELQSPQ